MDDTKPAAKSPRLDGVLQTDFTASKGNALQACIATVFGLDLSHVPNFINEPGDLYDNLRGFLRKRGLGFMKIVLDDKGCLSFAPGGDKVIVLLAGDSPRGAHRHVVVAEIRAGETKPIPIFDPHPSSEYLLSHLWVGLFVCLDVKAKEKLASQE